MARKKARNDEPEASLLDRRTFLQAAGAAVASAAAVGAGSGSATAVSAGYGSGGYGTVAYGGSPVQPSAGSPPFIDSFTLTKSEQLGANRQLVVKWDVGDEDGDLETVEVTAVAGAKSMNFDVKKVSGSRDTGWKIFKFKVGTSLDVTLRVTDGAGNVETRTESVTL